MHCFSTCMGSVMGHAFAKQLVSRAQSVVTFFRASHKPLALLKQFALAMGIKRMLVTSNKTRFTSVHAMLESLLRLKEALLRVVREHKGILSAAVLSTLTDPMFFIALEQVCQLLVPFTLVIQAIQSDNATLADVMRYWIFLGRSMQKLVANLTDASFKAHCISAFNWRVKDMHNPHAHMGLFLHPWYRGQAAKTDAQFDALRSTAMKMWKYNGKHGTEGKALLGELKQYRTGAKPFLGTLANGDLDGVRTYWINIQHSAAASGAPLQLPALALIIHDIKPHAADPEKTFSTMGMYGSDRRNQLLNETTTAMTVIKMHHTKKNDR